MLREIKRDDRSVDLLGKLKAEVRVTRQPRKRRAANALRILFVTGVKDFARNAFYLSSTKTAGCVGIFGSPLLLLPRCAAISATWPMRRWGVPAQKEGHL